jgi:thiamine-phosphate pyrophosphorylase
MHELKRLADINTNRACEGLRILEDHVRYRAELAPWLDAVKDWRSTLRRLAPPDGLAFRAALEDPGPACTGRQMARAGARDLFRVNAGRVQEALRALEEYAKWLAPDQVAVLEGMRFQVYELEKAWAGPRQARLKLLGTDLYGITASAFARGRDNVAVARAMLDAGIRVVQYREKDLDGRTMFRECLELRRLAARAGALFPVNDHVDLALAVDADGVHIGQDDLPPEAVRGLIGPDRILGISTHSPEQARAAVAAGADYLGVGPLFRTHTKKDVCEPVGLEYLDYAAAHVGIPFVAIGGIKRHNLATVRARGARLVALVTEITEADDIERRIAEIRAIHSGSEQHA